LIVAFIIFNLLMIPNEAYPLPSLPLSSKMPELQDEVSLLPSVSKEGDCNGYFAAGKHI
jgi:hypothetical protein